jgi:hypothetical protein
MSKIKSILTALLGIAFLFTIELRAQNILFNYTDGTNASYNLEDVRKITFDLDVMKLHLSDESVYSWDVSTISHYQYNESLLNVQDLLNNTNALEVVVFPNPTNITLNVHYNLAKEDQITIELFDMQGKLISQEIKGNQASGKHHHAIDVSNLTKGSYMCRINGQQQSITKTVNKN